jgi:hypothetical protein
MPMISREQILQEIRRDGIEKTKSRALHVNPDTRVECDSVIQEGASSETLARQETREEENPSIFRKAPAISEEADSIPDKARRYARWSNIIAAIALAITMIMAIIEYKSNTF